MVGNEAVAHRSEGQEWVLCWTSAAGSPVSFADPRMCRGSVPPPESNPLQGWYLMTPLKGSGGEAGLTERKLRGEHQRCHLEQ